MDLSAWAHAKNILCVRLDSAGDVLMTTPALRALKDSVRGRRVTLLTSPAGAGIAWMVPAIDEVIVYDAPWVKNDLPETGSSGEYEMAEALRGHGFDGAVIFCVFSQNPLPAAFLCRLADIPLRLAYCRENPYRILSHWIPDDEPKKFIRHEVERQLELVKTIGCVPRDDRFSLRVPAYARRSVRRMLDDVPSFSRQPSVVIHPGATALSRRYPAEHFVVVADAVARNLGANVIFTGSVSEVALVEDIRSRMRAPSRSFAGRLDIPGLCALISSVSLLITNNTGPAHIAAAVGTPTVDIYAQTNPQHTPWKVESRVLTHDVSCKYCYKSVCPEGHHNCLRLISPARVIQAAAELLDKGIEGMAMAQVAADERMQ